MQRLEGYNIHLSEQQLEQFKKYYEMVVEKNKVMNLTAITEEQEFILKHFIDSLSILDVPCLKKLANEPLSVIDVGTGAGFPGIPLKIAFPQLKVTLLDSLQKRVLFLREVIDELGLEDIEAVHSRAEDGARDASLRESFDLVVSRAVANQAVLTEYCLPFTKTGGLFAAYKSGSIDEELEASKKAISLLGGQLKECHRITLPGSDIPRSFVIIKKTKPTPKRFPRKPGDIKKFPL